jgi:hypothetical protein
MSENPGQPPAAREQQRLMTVASRLYPSAASASAT